MTRAYLCLPTFLLVVLTLATCGSSRTSEGRPGAAPTPGFQQYWSQGLGELNHYALSQARYGELRQGDAVLIFVTEDFLTTEQVKFEGKGSGAHTSVLKLNMIERFNTGIYDYSLMTSCFSPVDGTPALKVNTSVQDWCGQVFIQLNRKERGYAGRSFSYFQSEGDRTFNTPDVWLEDALWNQLRIDPAKVPVGKFNVLPSLRYLSLVHKPSTSVEVSATVVVQGDTSSYTMAFPTLQRTLTIRYRTSFPYGILGWSETRPDGFNANPPVLTTEARLTHSSNLPYWQLNSNANDSLRKTLGLDRMPVR